MVSFIQITTEHNKNFLIYFTDHQFDFFTHSIEQQKNRFTALMKYLKKIMAMNFGCIVYATWKLDINKNAEKKNSAGCQCITCKQSHYI